MSYGKDGKVIIPVVGAFGEMSSDVYAIIDLVASILTHEHLSYYSEHPSAIKGMFQQNIYRSLGLSAHLGPARTSRLSTQTPSPTTTPPVMTEMTRQTSTKSTSTPTPAFLRPNKPLRSAPKRSARLHQ